MNWRDDKRRPGPRRPAEDLIGLARSRTSARSIGGQESVDIVPLPLPRPSPVGWAAHGDPAISSTGLGATDSRGAWPPMPDEIPSRDCDMIGVASARGDVAAPVTALRERSSRVAIPVAARSPATPTPAERQERDEELTPSSSRRVLEDVAHQATPSARKPLTSSNPAAVLKTMPRVNFVEISGAQVEQRRDAGPGS